jgi:hypothetical protein
MHKSQLLKSIGFSDEFIKYIEEYNEKDINNLTDLNLEAQQPGDLTVDTTELHIKGKTNPDSSELTII